MNEQQQTATKNWKKPTAFTLDERHLQIVGGYAHQWGVSRSAAARRIFEQFAAAGQGRGQGQQGQ